MRVRTSSLFCVALLTSSLVSTAPAAAQEARLLRYNLQEGQTFRMVTTTESESSQTFQGMDQTTKQTMVQGTRMEVVSVDADGAARLRYTTESVRVSMETPMGLLEYDSSQPDAVVPQALRPIALTQGAVYLMTMDPDGSVRDVTGGEDMLDRLLDGMDFPPGMTKEGLREELEARFGDEAMATSFGQNLSGYPVDPVAVGASWTRTARTPGFPLAMESVTTLTGRSGGTVTLATQATLSSDSASVLEMGGMTQRFDVTGTSSGTMEIEESTGMHFRSRSEMTMTGTVTISMGGRDMPIPMTTRTVNTVERVQGG